MFNEKSVISTDFNVIKVVNPEVVWICETVDDRDAFVSSTAYINQDGNIFLEAVTTDAEDIVSFKADYYGGRGVGYNCGSGRAGIIGDHQIKGVGVTPLLGDISENLYNGTGMYPLYEGITELLVYSFFKEVLPVGIVPYKALLRIGTSKYFVTAEEATSVQRGDTELALIIRNNTARVGHCFQNFQFKPRNDSKCNVISDLERVKLACQNMADCEVDPLNPKVIERFVIGSAKQIAFARIHRVAHGALSPSNLAIDGRWLDLTNMTGVPNNYDSHAGVNGISFLNEFDALIDIISEWVETYNKFNGYDIEPSRFIRLYYEYFNQYITIYTMELFGFDPSKLDVFPKNAPEWFCNMYFERISRAEHALNGVPTVQDDNERILTFLHELFTSAQQEKDNPISRIYKIDMRKNSCGFTRMNAFCLYKSLAIYKNVFYRKMYYIGNTYKYARHIVSNKQDVEFALKEYSDTALWLFKEQSLLFKNHHTSISFDADGYKISHDGVVTMCNSTDDILAVIDLLNEDQFCIGLISYKDEVKGLLRELCRTFKL